MMYFLRKSAQWLVFLAATVAFFSLPIILRDHSPGKTGQTRPLKVTAKSVVLEFVPSVAETSVDGNSTALIMSVDVDTMTGYVSLYVNDREVDSTPARGATRLKFPGVALRQGENEIEAFFRTANGDTVAFRKLRIISGKN